MSRFIERNDGTLSRKRQTPTGSPTLLHACNLTANLSTLQSMVHLLCIDFLLVLLRMLLGKYSMLLGMLLVLLLDLVCFVSAAGLPNRTAAIMGPIHMLGLHLPLC